MDIVRKHLSLIKVIVIILELVALFLLFGDQLTLEGNTYTYSAVFFKGSSEISSSPIGFIGYLFIILPIFIQTFSLILLLSKNKDLYRNDILAMDIVSILFSAVPLTLIALMPYYSYSDSILSPIAILSLVIVSLTILVLIYFVVIDVLVVKNNVEESYSNFVNKYTRIFTRLMNIFRAGLSVTMIVGGLTTLSAVSMAFFPQLELEDGTSLTLNEIYIVAKDGGANYPLFIYIAYPLLFVSCLMMIIIPIRTFGKISKNPEKKKIKTWEYVTILILSLTSIISVSLLPQMVKGSSLSAYAISMISLSCSGLVIAARKLLFSLIMSIPHFVVNDLPKLKSWLSTLETKYLMETSLILSIVGIILVLVPLPSNGLYLPLVILILGLVISLILNGVYMNKEKKVWINLSISLINVLTLSLSLLIEFTLFEATLSITLLLVDIVALIIIILGFLGFSYELIRQNKKRKEVFKTSS